LIVRHFTATVHAGQQEAFKIFFLETALPLVRSHKGLVSVRVGMPHESSPREFAMVTVWSDLEALKVFAGELWQEAVIHPDEEHLIEKVRVEHYYDGDPSGSLAD
jgi:heme-degrading monooxygenase HmoA